MELKTTWDLSPLLKDDNDPRREALRTEIEKATKQFAEKWRTDQAYLSDPAALVQALDEFEAWQRVYGGGGDEAYFFWLRSEQDESDPVLKAHLQKSEDFGNKIMNKIRFFELSIAKIPESEQAKFLAHPGLQNYKHFLEKLFREAKYLLSEPEEKILALKSGPAYGNWVRLVSGLLSKEEASVPTEKGVTETKNFSEILSLIDSREKRVRDAAAEAVNATFKKHLEIGEAELNSVLGDKKIDDELRKLSRPDMARHLSDDIETETVDAMLQAVEAKFDIARRYYALKARLLGVPRLAYHERNVPYGDLDKTYDFPAAVALVQQVFTGLDPEFGDILARFARDGHFDVYPRKGKVGGAFCAHNLLSQPTYVLLNHTDKLKDVLTLAHEMGHGINNELMRPVRHALDFGTSTATAEVASTFMEDFVLEALVREADPELQLAILMYRLNDDVSSIFRQVACYRFEQALHTAYRAQGYLAAPEIGKLFQANMRAYMGEAVEQSPGSENWWLYWSHIRRFFYVYSYASGLLISKSLQASVRAKPTIIQGVKGFLAAGVSDSPRNIFRKLDVDIAEPAFWEKGLTEIDRSLAQATELAQKLGKLK